MHRAMQKRGGNEVHLKTEVNQVSTNLSPAEYSILTSFDLIRTATVISHAAINALEDLKHTVADTAVEGMRLMKQKLHNYLFVFHFNEMTKHCLGLEY